MDADALVIPVTPFSDEGIADLLLRSAGLNLTTPDIVLSLAGFGVGELRPFRVTPRTMLTRRQNYGGLSKLVGCAVKPIADRIILRDWGRIDFFGASIRASNISPSRRVAPGYLKLRGHQRAIWSLSHLDFDPDTGERLLDSCPVCGETRLSWSMLRYHACTACGRVSDLTEVPPVPADVVDGDVSSLILSLVAPHLLGAAHRSLDPIFSSIPRGDLFDLVIDLAHLAACGNMESIDWAASLPGYRIAAAAQLLLEGPEDLQCRLQAFIDTREVANKAPSFLKLVRRTRDRHLAQILLSRVLLHTSAPAGTWCQYSGTLLQCRSRGLYDNQSCNAANGIDAYRASAQVRGHCRHLGITMPSLLHTADGLGPASKASPSTAEQILEAGNLIEAALQGSSASEPHQGHAHSVGLKNFVSSIFLRDFDVWPTVFTHLVGQKSTRFTSMPPRVSSNLLARAVLKEPSLLISFLRGYPHTSCRYWNVPLTPAEVMIVLGIGYQVIAFYQAERLLPHNISLSVLRNFRMTYATSGDVRRRVKPTSRARPYQSNVLSSLGIPSMRFLGVTLWERSEIERVFGDELFEAIS